MCVIHPTEEHCLPITRIYIYDEVGGENKYEPFSNQYYRLLFFPICSVDYLLLESQGRKWNDLWAYARLPNDGIIDI